MLTKELTDEQVITVFNDWDEGQAYEAERRTLTKAQLCGDTLCTYYGFDAPCGFAWADTSAHEIFELVTRKPWRTFEIGVLRGKGVEMPEILQGIDFMRAMNADASSWVQRILKATPINIAPIEAGASSGDVCHWLSYVIWEMPELMRLNLESPYLFGKICLELERFLNASQSGPSDSLQD